MKKLFKDTILFVKKHEKAIFIIVLLLILIKPTLFFLDLSDEYFSKGYEKRYDYYKDRYYESQYVKKVNPVILPDETFHMFAGGFVLNGGNPILIIHDHPPLGKYLIALSILLFDNAKTVVAIALIMSGLGIFLLSRLATGGMLFALIPLGIFINEPLFLNKLKYAPLVEPLQLPFILFAFYFFIKAMNEKKYMRWFVLTSIMLGFVISIRFFVTGAIITFCMGLVLLLQERSINKKLISFVFSLPIALVVLVLSYTKTMMDGYSIIQVFGTQKYILAYHSSKFILPLSFWDLLLFNRWHTWWGDREILSDPQWLISWPIATISSGAYILLALFKKVKLNNAEKLISLWLIIYMITLSTGYTSTNYFLAIIPFLYILSASLLRKILLYTYNNIHPIK